MEISIVLAILVGILAVLQGWQMIAAKRNKNNNSDSKSSNPNPGFYMKQNSILEKLNEINSAINTTNSSLGRMEQRLEDIWNKVRT